MPSLGQVICACGQRCQTSDFLKTRLASPPTSFSNIFVFSKFQLVEYWSLMSVMKFELRTSGVGNDRSTN